MAKQITRTVKIYTINAATVSAKNGKVETAPLKPITVEDETVTQENAVKFVQKEFGKKQQYVILSIEEAATTYAVPFDVFMANAKKLEKVEKPAAAEQTFEPAAQ